MLLAKTPLASSSAIANLSPWGHHGKLEGHVVQKLVTQLRHTMETIEDFKEDDRPIQVHTNQSAISSKNNKIDGAGSENDEVEEKEVERRAESDHADTHSTITKRNKKALIDSKPSPSPSNMSTTIATATAGAKSTVRRNHTEPEKQLDDDDVDKFIRRKGDGEKNDDDNVEISKTKSEEGRTTKKVDQTGRKEVEEGNYHDNFL